MPITSGDTFVQGTLALGESDCRNCLDRRVCRVRDRNKRVGFVVGVLFLELNGYRFIASEEDAAQAVLSLAAETLEESAFAVWMRANAKRP